MKLCIFFLCMCARVRKTQEGKVGTGLSSNFLPFTFCLHCNKEAIQWRNTAEEGFSTILKSPPPCEHARNPPALYRHPTGYTSRFSTTLKQSEAWKRKKKTASNACSRWWKAWNFVRLNATLTVLFWYFCPRSPLYRRDLVLAFSLSFFLSANPSIFILRRKSCPKKFWTGDNLQRAALPLCFFFFFTSCPTGTLVFDVQAGLKPTISVRHFLAALEDGSRASICQQASFLHRAGECFRIFLIH